jgi:hypothetical protein
MHLILFWLGKLETERLRDDMGAFCEGNTLARSLFQGNFICMANIIFSCDYTMIAIMGKSLHKLETESHGIWTSLTADFAAWWPSGLSSSFCCTFTLSTSKEGLEG